MSKDYEPVSPIWGGEEEAPSFFSLTISNLYWAVRRAKITGVFVNDAKVWGTPQNIAVGTKYHGKVWTHLSGAPSEVYRSLTKTAGQLMAEKLEDYKTLKHGLSEYALPVIAQAVRVLEADALDRSEKTLEIAQWLLRLQQSLEGKKGPTRDNLVWQAVAAAPPGWCHIRSTMINTLLDDVAVGLDYETIRRRWAEKMHPLQYQRPTTLSEGAITQANKLIEQLGAAGALERRFARLEDVLSFVWQPQVLAEAPQTKQEGRVFDSLRLKNQPIREVELPTVKMTWEKFRKDVLPGALEIEYKLPLGREAFYGLVTATNPAAPPILQWDGLRAETTGPGDYPRELPRNPCSWYFYHGGSAADGWGLVPGAWCKVTAICYKPYQWQQPHKFTHHGEGVLFVLEGAQDKGYQKGALFFPETLRSEYHGVRQVLEAYSQSHSLTGKEEGNANGIALQKGQEVSYQLRVKTATGMVSVTLDRWE